MVLEHTVSILDIVVTVIIQIVAVPVGVERRAQRAWAILQEFELNP